MALLTTDLVPPRDRAAFIGDLVSQQLMETYVRRVTDGRVHGKIRGEIIGELPVAEITGANIRATRTRALIARSPLPYYCVCIQLTGMSRYRWGEQDAAVFSGDIFILDALHAFEIDVERPFQHLVIRIPKPWVDSRVAQPRCVAGTRLRREHPLSRFFASYVRHGLETAAELSPHAATLFATHAVELLAQALGERPSGESLPYEALRAALFVRACRTIALRFAEPDLAPSEVARALGVSRRLLERVFAERGETVMGQVWDERVSRAARLLASANAAHRTVTEIAFACGFNDSAHFTRAFAARKNMTPTQWRRRAYEGDSLWGF